MVLSMQLPSGIFSPKKHQKPNTDINIKKLKTSLKTKKQKTDTVHSAGSKHQVLSSKSAQSNPWYSSFNGLTGSYPTNLPSTLDMNLNMKYLRMIYTSLSTINNSQQINDQEQIRNIASTFELPDDITKGQILAMLHQLPQFIDMEESKFAIVMDHMVKQLSQGDEELTSTNLIS